MVLLAGAGKYETVGDPRSLRSLQMDAKPVVYSVAGRKIDPNSVCSASAASVYLVFSKGKAYRIPIIDNQHQQRIQAFDSMTGGYP